MAQRNARRNGLEHQCQFVVEDLYSATGQAEFMSEQGQAPDALLLDPPRSGAGVNLEAWTRPSSIKQVVYVSCNPQSFADDAPAPAASGFSTSRGRRLRYVPTNGAYRNRGQLCA